MTMTITLQILATKNINNMLLIQSTHVLWQAIIHVYDWSKAEHIQVKRTMTLQHIAPIPRLRLCTCLILPMDGFVIKNVVRMSITFNDPTNSCPCMKGQDQRDDMTTGKQPLLTLHPILTVDMPDRLIMLCSH